MGTTLIFFGFYKYPIVLSYVGVIVSTSFFIFLFETFFVSSIIIIRYPEAILDLQIREKRGIMAASNPICKNSIF